ncbi:MAG: MFS transporter, partial [Pirellulaceae bacterium]
LAEAGFFPGIIVYLTHWFPAKDRSKALSFFLIASPIAMIIGPAISREMLPIGTSEIVDGVVQSVVPELWGMKGWQWIYIFWGIPAVLMGLAVLYLLPDKPHEASWLLPEER